MGAHRVPAVAPSAPTSEVGPGVAWFAPYHCHHLGLKSLHLLTPVFHTHIMNTFWFWKLSFSVAVQWASYVWLLATSWTVACQDSLSLPITWNLPKFMFTVSVIPSSHLFLWCPLLLLPSISFPASGTFPMSWLFASGDQNTGASTSASVLPMSIQDWFPLRLTGLVSKVLSGVFSGTTVRRHQFFGALSFLRSSSHNHMWPLGRP